MADLLPSIPDATVSEEAEPRVVGLEDEAAEDVLGALSSGTARELFAALNDEPAHPSALADSIDTSLQNVQYHLAKLEDAGMVEVVDTAYSAKGREMDVYAPADQPLVVFAGDDDDQSLLAQALGRLLGGVGVIAGASLAVRGLVRSGETTTPVESGGADGGAGAGAVPSSDDAERGADAGDGGGGGVGADAPTDSGDAGADQPAAGEDGSGAEPPDGSEADGTYSEHLSDAELNSIDLSNVSGLEGQYALEGDTVAGSGESVGSVEPASHELSWLVEPLAATGLPPSIAVAVLGGSLLAGGFVAWLYRKRQTRV